jgi:hypothetical protein
MIHNHVNKRREAVLEMASRRMTPNEIATSLGEPVARIYNDLRLMKIPRRPISPTKRIVHLYNSGIPAGTFTELLSALTDSEFDKVFAVSAKEGSLSGGLLRLIRQDGGFSQ